MKYLVNRIGLLTLAVLFMAGTALQAQPADQSDSSNKANVVLNAQSGSKMMINGTSTIHDWEAEVDEFTASVELTQPVADTSFAKIGDYLVGAEVTVPVENIESGKGGMNSKIYGAFDKKKHPTITYKLEKASLASEKPNTENTIVLNTSGKLTMHGTTKPVDMKVTVERLADGKYKFSGEKKLNMTEYKMDPPSAVFGTIKAGEEVTVKFDLVASK